MTLFRRRSVRDRVSPVERALTVVIPLGLIAVAAWVHHRGTQVNPDLFRLREGALKQPASAPVIYKRTPQVFGAEAVQGDVVASRLVDGLPGAGWKRAGEVESFGPDNVYEKIDGREGLYKSFNFRHLHAASWELAGTSLRMDLEVFEQATPQDAAGVMGAERAGMKNATAGDDRVSFANGMVRVVGRYYLRFIGSDDDERVRQAARTASTALDGLAGDAAPITTTAPNTGAPQPGTPVRAGIPPVESWTPSSHPLVKMGARAGSLQFQSQNGLGMDYLKGLHLGTFTSGGVEVTGWVHASNDEKTASDIQARYGAHLRTQGTASESGGVLLVKVNMLGTVETVARAGPFVVGVTEAPSEDAARAVTSVLLKGFAGGAD